MLKCAINILKVTIDLLSSVPCLCIASSQPDLSALELLSSAYYKDELMYKKFLN